MNQKRISFTIAFLCFCSITFAQITRTSVVELFTNTSCGICAANNGGIYNSINNHPKTVSISFHPSSPYSNDFFNQQNKTENDDRTKFYDIFGSTPRVVLNGSSIAYSNLNAALTSAASTLTNFKLDITQNQNSSNLFEVRVVITKIAQDTLKNALLFVGAFEDTIYQTTNNGEKVHYQVFRKTLSSIGGNSLPLPIQINDSTVVSFEYEKQPSWVLGRMHTIGILQKANKELINSALSKNQITNQTSGIHPNFNPSNFHFYPNPVQNGYIHTSMETEFLKIQNQFGHSLKVVNQAGMSEPIYVGDLAKGVYILQATTKNGIHFQKIIIQ